MDRREFLKRGGSVLAGGVLAKLGVFESVASAATPIGRPPNIVLILVDEMRFPSAFPAGVSTPDEFLRRFMPNLYELWRHGVKFEGYYSSGNACSPARATIATGLYPHQQWLLATRTTSGPSLQPGFPTYGKLLRALGYQTPYFGKWHLSNPPANGSLNGYLENYGFQGFTTPDPTGLNGEGAAKDGPVIADAAVSWLEQSSAAAQPFCVTVSFVNPHDKQFLWAGSEGDHYEQLFKGQSLKPFVTDYTSVASEDSPPSLPYPAVPPNWEASADLPAHGKPITQQVVRAFQEAVWGGASDNPAPAVNPPAFTGAAGGANAGGFSVLPSPLHPDQLGVAIAPYRYWKRGSDMYTLVQQMVDEQIGKVVAAVPKDQLANTVFVFASDHGEYAGAHGLLSGKLGTAYEEAIHIPLVVVDPSGRFTRQVSTPRRQLASSVDLAPMLVTLGNHGSTSWMTGDYRRIYGERLNLVTLLGNPRAAGREHVVFATDEILPAAMNYAHAPTHVLAVRTHEAKLVTYSHWAPGTTRVIPRSVQLEFYDYATAAGRAETRSHPHDPRAKTLANKLFRQYVPQQMEAPLPSSLRSTVAKARASYIAFNALTDAYSYKELGPQQKLGTVLGYGRGPF
ncbi:MAG: sulfatase-like hydrolase/transferase [Solirubrobacterales bacterium]|nr:sulfatase-like hydrolase/transferase [Solirubrobacterales bacterium]